MYYEHRDAQFIAAEVCSFCQKSRENMTRFSCVNQCSLTLMVWSSENSKSSLFCSQNGLLTVRDCFCQIRTCILKYFVLQKQDFCCCILHFFFFFFDRESTVLNTIAAIPLSLLVVHNSVQIMEASKAQRTKWAGKWAEDYPKEPCMFRFSTHQMQTGFFVVFLSTPGNIQELCKKTGFWRNFIRNLKMENMNRSQKESVHRKLTVLLPASWCFGFFEFVIDVLLFFFFFCFCFLLLSFFARTRYSLCIDLYKCFRWCYEWLDVHRWDWM